MPYYLAYNKKSNVVVKWLGHTATKKQMEARLKEYDAPKYVKPLKVRKYGGRR